jgi:hypothetical protein
LYASQPASAEQTVSEATSLQVRNGTYRAQLAKIAAEELRWQGFKIVDTAPADHPEYKQTRIIVFKDKPEATQLLARQLGVKAENIIQQPDPNQPADMMVVLGEDYDPCRQ